MAISEPDAPLDVPAEKSVPLKSGAVEASTWKPSEAIGTIPI